MKKKLLATILLLSTFACSQAQIWNFSESPFGAIASYSTNTTVSNLTISPKSGTPIAIDGNTKSIDDYTFSFRLKLGATGTIDDKENHPYLPSSAYVSFPVTGNSTITVYGMSSSSSSTRTLAITDGTVKLGGLTNDGTTIGKGEVTYTGGTGTIYLYSESSGFNIYLIKVTQSSGINDSQATKGAVVSSKRYDTTGREVSENASGLIIQKKTYENGATETQKVLVKK
jgi:hypothetical protein